MRRCITAIALLLFGASSLTALAEPISTVEIVGFEATPLFPRQSELAQLCNLTVVNHGTEPVALKATVTHPDKSVQNVDLGNIKSGTSTLRLLLPDVSATEKINIDLIGGGDSKPLAHWEGNHDPQRKWIIYVVKSAHEDLGYEDYIFNKQAQIADNIDLARKQSGVKDSPDIAPGSATTKPSPRHYHYQIESLMSQQNYIDERSEAAWRDLIEESVKPGKMTLVGVPNGVHSHWMDYEELARFMYPGRRELRDRFGVDTKLFQIVDNPSISWSACQAAVNAGYKYIGRFGQPWRAGDNNNYATTHLPALFWWQAPDGVHKALFGWRNHYGLSFWYGQSGGGDADTDLIDFAATNVTRELREVENGSLGPYPADALLIPSYSDHETPWFDVRPLNRWQTTYRYPEIRIAGAEDFFEYVDKKFGDKLPTLAGDLNNNSGDYATIDPESQGWKRQAARLLPLAESQATFASVLDPSLLPPEAQINRTFARMFDYDEHSWPTSPEANDIHKFNSQWVKKNEADRALKATTNLLDQSSAALYAHIPTGDDKSIVVFNPLAHERTDLVEFGGVLSGLKEVGGAAVDVQANATKTTFIAANVPAFGYKVYRVVESSASAKSSLRAADQLENEFYLVRFDKVTGTVVSIFDKELKRELIDPAATEKFNQMVWVHSTNRTSPDLKLVSPSKAKSLHGTAGSVSAEMVAEIDDSKTGAAITQTVRLYAGLKRIDVINDLRHVKALYSSRREDRYRDNIYYAFPIKVDDFEPRAEYPGGVVRPFTDQLRWGSHDFLTANRWVDVSNKSFGVTMAPWNAPTVSFGEIRYNKFSNDYKPTSSHLYSDAWSNRMAGLIDLCVDDTNATLGYSFSSHEGNWDSGATTKFGWSVASPLKASLLTTHQSGSLSNTKQSFASVSASNVHVTAIKPTAQPGRGWIVRLVETDGKPATDVVVDLPMFPIDSAMTCSLVEDDDQPLKVDGHQVKLSLGAFSMTTIRVFGKEQLPASVENLQTEAVSDSSIRLKWTQPSGKDVEFNIYRSEDPNDPPTVATLIGRAKGSEFVDSGLSIGTTYQYRVAAVTTKNTQGEASKPVAGKTDSKNTTAPLPVQDLGIIRRAKDGLTVYWQRSSEPDIARYLVYRGERADFEMNDASQVGAVSPAKVFLQLFRDDGLKAGTTYFYKVLGEDWAGHRQATSMVATATTPKE